MPVAAVFEFPVPVEHEESFLNGELALAVASPIDEAPARTTFYLSRWFDFEGGQYTLRSVAEDSALWIVSITQSNGRVFHSSPLGTPNDALIYLPKGRHRIDIVLSNVSVDPSACFVAFGLAQNGKLVYASAAEGWVFDTQPIEDADVPPLGDPRLGLPVFTVLPNWEPTIIERIEFKTEVMPSESDKEQRRSIRRFPRRSFEANFMRTAVRRARLENFFLGVGRNEVLVPIWIEQFKLTATLESTVTFPAGTLVMREYRAGELVWVNAGDPAVYEVLTIASIDLGNDTITFEDPPTLAWEAGSRIYPLRAARVLDAAQFQNHTDRIATLGARFSLVESEKWPEPSWGHCAPYFRFKINRADAVTLQHDRPTAFLLDNDHGRPDVTDIFSITRSATRYGLTLKGRQNVYAFRQFIHMARGRAVRFWMPSQTADMHAKGDFAGPYMDVHDDGLLDYVTQPQDIRALLAVVFSDGSGTIYRRIENVARISGGLRVYFTADMPAVELAKVERLMFILPARFDQDGFELTHQVDDSKIVQTAIMVRSANIEGLPDIECLVTSWTYPITYSDAIETGVSITGGAMFKMFAPEGVDIALTPIDSTLVRVAGYLTYALPDEAIDATVVVIDSTLEHAAGYATYEMADEAINAAVVIVNGTLQLMLISNVIAPEGVNATVTITNGTLT